MHRGDASWPWPFVATQRIAILDRELRLDLCATNLSDQAVPLYHPYFPADGAQLRFPAAGVWSVGDRKLPEHEIQPTGELDFLCGRAISNSVADHCFVHWGQPAHISWLGRSLALEVCASAFLPAAVVFIRPGADAFCFEPVPHVGNWLIYAGLSQRCQLSHQPTIFAIRLHSEREVQLSEVKLNLNALQGDRYVKAGGTSDSIGHGGWRSGGVHW